MTTTTTTQTRGHCQCCAREQAVLATGRMSKHGYTVKDGWFSGVCSGQSIRPVEVDRSVCDSTITQVRADCIKLRDHADRLQRGEIQPLEVKGNYDITLRDYRKLPFAEGTVMQQREARESAVWTTRRRAEMGESFANSLERMADTYHGQPLREVEVEAGPAPIRCGEQRQGATGTLTCTDTHKGRVYWKTAEGRKGWTGTQSWRRYPLA